MKNKTLQLATAAAEKIVKDEKLELPIDVFALAEQNNIIVEPKPIEAKGVSGMLLRYGDDFTIVYATHIKNEGFQRFSIAHELGHYFLPSHPDSVFRDSNIHESHAGFCSHNQIELEADHFAAGLLMPKSLFIKEAGKFQDGLIAIENLAKICKTSLVASSIRYAGLTDAAVAIIISSGAFVEYSFVSQGMYEFVGYTHLKKGMKIPKNSLTYAFNQHSANIKLVKRENSDTDLIHWFQTDHEISATEEVIGLGTYDKTLTIITANSIDADDNDEWEDPKFRR
ncbi:ImmA/IrrE family metallo-endopeptidase [Legionella drozanskii]|uniref:IrrE N-terminal-like domain-containing protein n=1 Tax=Legionella drozanskii LLAP-1 TaxID=1212489 RepID=A0A0W0SM83_9GAMM|nr:ImmA/IrrE family metallo-endopeptidase [Legionella drozanskii]KTC84519.1 hypothetical protein Ldro_2683 [Legionella drozanskii LLAP-1]